MQALITLAESPVHKWARRARRELLSVRALLTLSSDKVKVLHVKYCMGSPSNLGRFTLGAWNTPMSYACWWHSVSRCSTVVLVGTLLVLVRGLSRRCLVRAGSSTGHGFLALSLRWFYALVNWLAGCATHRWWSFYGMNDCW